MRILLYSIFIIFALTGCNKFSEKHNENGDTHMTFNIPKQCTLIDTTVAYQVAPYDDTQDYEDDTEVRIDDDIFKTKRVNKDIGYFNPDVIYSTDDIVKDGTKFFKRTSNPVFYVPALCNNLIDITTIGGFPIVEWNGISDTASITCTDVGGNESTTTYSFTEDLTKETTQYRYFTVNITYQDGAQDSFDMRLYKNIEEAPESAYVLYEGVLVQVYKKYNNTLSNTLAWMEITETFNETYNIDLTYIRKSVKQAPFDTKQYTSVTANNMTWTIQCNDFFNSVALGGLRAKEVRVTFKTKDEYENNVYVEPIVKQVNSLINTNVGDEKTTEIIYANKTYVDQDYIIIEIIENTHTYTGWTAIGEGEVTKHYGSEIGMIMPAMVYDVGATDISFSHDLKNHDRDQVSSISGYVDHIRGNRALSHKGTFYIPATSYDEIILIDKKLTNELIAIDGSDNILNTHADNENIFDSTKIIGRVKKITMATKVSNGDIQKTLPINFEFSEVV